MKLISVTVAVAVTPALVALPTVSFASTDPAHPVAPEVTNAKIAGVDTAALQAAPDPVPASVHPEVFTEERETDPFTIAGVSWEPTPSLAPGDVHVRVRVHEAGGWTAWQLLGDPDGPDAGSAEGAAARVGTTPLMTDGATGIQVRVDTTTGAVPEGLEVSTINPGTSAADDDLTPSAPAASAGAAARKPTIITRAQWGADERLRSGGTAYSSTIRAMTVHHTDGTNSYTRDQAAGLVRGIYAYHTLSLHWADVGYNFLVDRFGRIYEGRAGSITAPVRGAHSLGFNTDTMGVSAMGNFETAQPPAALVDGIAKVAGWKLSQYGVNPKGKAQLTSQGGSGVRYGAGTTVTMPAIDAHRDTFATACPGQYLYARLGTIRTKAAAYAGGSTSTTTAPKPVTTSGLYKAYGSLTLHTGSTGKAVRALQNELNRRGFGVGTADGDFGPMTASGLAKFQKAKKLKVTKRVHRNDWRALSNMSYTKTGVTTTSKPPTTKPPTTKPPTTTKPANLYQQYGGTTLSQGSSGAAVKALQAELNARGFHVGTADGDFGPMTASGVAKFQKASGLKVTKRVARNDWRALAGLSYSRTAAGTAGFDGDGRGDVLGVTPGGVLWTYPTGTNTVRSRKRSGSGWGKFTEVLSPGDWNGDRKADVVARRRDGNLYLYTGNGRGGFSGGAAKIGRGWNAFRQILGVGDWTGDGKPDLLAKRRNGELDLYKGDGKGHFAGRSKIGTGWNMYRTLVAPGDVNGDGKPDLLGITGSGRLFFYAGTQKGNGYAHMRGVGRGWNRYSAVLSTGDITGDGKTDLIVRARNGRSYVRPGLGGGGFRNQRALAAGWGAKMDLFAVR